MLNLPNISSHTFLSEYWQKKPLLIPNALPQFKNHLTPEEIAGLAMEEEIESRLITQDLEKSPQWTLQRGPFTEEAFTKLPKTHWTLLVQAVDRFVPEITALWEHFNFLPQWRIDDIMMSYAVEQGSVGPHYDNYDVFLYQAKGRRTWKLTTSDCVESNYLQDVALRIMKEFKVEQEFILEEGDMLYLPPHIGHHGISLSDDCITYSFGYRSYQDRELWDSFGEYLYSKTRVPSFYRDPSWNQLKATSELPPEALHQARATMQSLLDNDDLMEDWFGRFATQLDSHADSLLPILSAQDESLNAEEFKNHLLDSKGLVRSPLCRMAYSKSDRDDHPVTFYINGDIWCINPITSALVEKIANNRTLLLADILPFLDNAKNESLLHDLWTVQILEFLE